MRRHAPTNYAIIRDVLALEPSTMATQRQVKLEPAVAVAAARSGMVRARMADAER